MHRLSVNVRRILIVLVLCTPLTTRPAEALAFPKVHRVDGGAGEMFANANKPLLAVVVTHGHPDHYGGIAQLVNGSSTIPVVATAGVDAIIRRDDAMRGARLAAAGFDWAKVRTFPNVLVSEGVEIRLGDITLTPVDVGAAESHHDSLWILHGPEGNQVFVGDLIRAEVSDLAQGRTSLSPEQSKELERRMVRFAGHDRVSRWVIEGGSPVARELTIDSSGPIQ